MLETDVLKLSVDTWGKAKIEPDLNERDKLYHEVVVLRELQRYSEQFGNGELGKFIYKIKTIYDKNGGDVE